MKQMRNTPPRKRILDACCGGRMFWFEKRHRDVLFVDHRRERHEFSGNRTVDVDPDLVADFTDLPFPDNRFFLVVFDPPHLRHNGRTGWQAKKYGRLDSDWRSLLARGFEECFRVLKRNGTLVFKWNECDIPVSQVLALTNRRPLFGNRCGKQAKSHWIVFMK